MSQHHVDVFHVLLAGREGKRTNFLHRLVSWSVLLSCFCAILEGFVVLIVSWDRIWQKANLLELFPVYSHRPEIKT